MRKILVVEDDRDIATVLGMRLRSAGYNVVVAFDAVSGLSMASQTRPDLLLLDISMPGGGGLLVARRVRNMAPTATTPIIFLTASKDPALRDQAMGLGASDFFEKPYDGAVLVAAIARALGDSPEASRAA